MSMKNSKGSIGNRIRDLSAFSAGPQPTVPPRAPFILGTHPIFTFILEALTIHN
jgi:hypothetical protein